MPNYLDSCQVQGQADLLSMAYNGKIRLGSTRGVGVVAFLYCLVYKLSTGQKQVLQLTLTYYHTRFELNMYIIVMAFSILCWSRLSSCSSHLELDEIKKLFHY